MNKIKSAAAAVERAKGAVAEAENTLANAREALDGALAEVGWRRLGGAFSPGATPLYTSAVYPDATLDVDAVLAHLEHMRRVAA